MGGHRKAFEDKLSRLDITHRFSHVLFFLASAVLHLNHFHLYRRNTQYQQARTVFLSLVFKKLDWPEAIWEAWLAFEYLHGSAQELEVCLDKIELAQNQVNARRAKVSVKVVRHV